MNAFKKSILILSLCATLSASASASAFAFASASAFAFATEKFDVRGDRAAQLMTALEKAGAKITAVPDASFVTVTRVSCSEGYQIGHGPFAQCSFQEQIPVGGMSHAIFLRTFEVRDEAARVLIGALEDAGVKGQHYIEMSGYAADSIHCSAAFFGPAGPNHFGRSCELTVAQ